MVALIGNLVEWRCIKYMMTAIHEFLSQGKVPTTIMDQLIKKYMRSPKNRRTLALSMVGPAKRFINELQTKTTPPERVTETIKYASKLLRHAEKVVGRMVLMGEPLEVTFLLETVSFPKVLGDLKKQVLLKKRQQKG